LQQADPQRLLRVEVPRPIADMPTQKPLPHWASDMHVLPLD
jgi:hypothetical protein